MPNKNFIAPNGSQTVNLWQCQPTRHGLRSCSIFTGRSYDNVSGKQMNVYP